MTIKNHRGSGGGDNRAQVSSEAIERFQRGWDDRETVEQQPADAAMNVADAAMNVKEEDLCPHF